MNQEKRIKKNNNYKKNLEKRGGITKKSSSLENYSDGILKSKKCIPQGVYEFVRTKSHGKDVTREKYIYRWNKASTEAKEQCKKDRIARLASKGEIVTQSKIKPIKDYSTLLEEHRKKVKEMKAVKQAKLETLVFSNLHNKLISDLFGTENKLTKRMIAKDMHEFKLRRISNKLKETKEAIKKRYDESKNFFVKFVYKDDNNKLYTASSFYTNDKLKVIKELAYRMNAKLVKDDPHYHHISIIDNHTPLKDVLFIYNSETPTDETIVDVSQEEDPS